MKSHGITIPKVTVTFSHAQVDWLNWVADERRTSVSEIIRRLVDETRGAYLTPPDARTALATSSDNATNRTNATG